MASGTGEVLTCVSIVLAKWCVRKVTRLQFQIKPVWDLRHGSSFLRWWNCVQTDNNKCELKLESEVKQLTGRVH